MSNLNNLVTKIVEDAKKEAASIIEKAEQEQNKIVNDSKSEAKSKKAEILAKADREAKTRKDRVISNAELQVRNNKLEAKQKVIDNVFDLAVNKLKEIPQDKYLQFIKHTIMSLDIIGDEEIIVNPEDSKKLTSEFINAINADLKAKGKKGEIKLSSENRAIKGGYILAKNGIEINNTFEALVHSMRDELEQEVIQTLFS